MSGAASEGAAGLCHRQEQGSVPHPQKPPAGAHSRSECVYVFGTDISNITELADSTPTMHYPGSYMGWSSLYASRQ